MSAAEATVDAKARLLDAAAECFAERGFHGTTIREIAERAGVNVAACHYHVGSKQDLYVEVLRAQFALVKAQMQAAGVAVTADDLARRSRADVEALVARRIRVMLQFLLGPPPSLHGTLMQREMCDPSAALPIIVAEFVEPFTAEIGALVERLAPQLDAEAVERCTLSMIGQVLFYRFALPIVHARWGADAINPVTLDGLAQHIATFSMGGLAARARTPKPARRPSRARARRSS